MTGAGSSTDSRKMTSRERQELEKRARRHAREAWLLLLEIQERSGWRTGAFKSVAGYSGAVWGVPAEIWSEWLRTGLVSLAQLAGAAAIGAAQADAGVDAGLQLIELAAIRRRIQAAAELDGDGQTAALLELLGDRGPSPRASANGRGPGQRRGKYLRATQRPGSGSGPDWRSRLLNVLATQRKKVNKLRRTDPATATMFDDIVRRLEGREV